MIPTTFVIPPGYIHLKTGERKREGDRYLNRVCQSEYEWAWSAHVESGTDWNTLVRYDQTVIRPVPVPTPAAQPFNMKSSLGQLFASITHANDDGHGWELDGEKAVLVAWEDLERVMDLVKKQEQQPTSLEPSQDAEKLIETFYAAAVNYDCFAHDLPPASALVVRALEKVATARAALLAEFSRLQALDPDWEALCMDELGRRKTLGRKLEEAQEEIHQLKKQLAGPQAQPPKEAHEADTREALARPTEMREEINFDKWFRSVPYEGSPSMAAKKGWMARAGMEKL